MSLGLHWLVDLYRKQNDTFFEANKKKRSRNRLTQLFTPARATTLWRHCSRRGGRSTVTQAALCCSVQRMREWNPRGEVCVCAQTCVQYTSTTAWCRDGPLSSPPAHRLSLVPPPSFADSKQSWDWRHAHTTVRAPARPPANQHAHTNTRTGSHLDKAGTPSLSLVLLFLPHFVLWEGRTETGPPCARFSCTYSRKHTLSNERRENQRHRNYGWGGEWAWR